MSTSKTKTAAVVASSVVTVALDAHPLVLALIAGDSGLATQAIVELNLPFADTQAIIETLSPLKKDLKAYYKDIKAENDRLAAERVAKQTAAAAEILENAKTEMLAQLQAKGVPLEEANVLLAGFLVGNKTRKPRATTTIVVDDKEYVINGRMSNEVKALIAASGLSNEEFIKQHLKADTAESTEAAE